MEGTPVKAIHPLDEEERRKQLFIRWAAEGREAGEIVDLAREIGWDLTERRVRTLRKKYRQEIIKYAHEKTQELMSKIERAAKPLRVQKVDEIAARLEDALDELLGEEWSTPKQRMEAIRIAAKIADTLMKAYRLIAEETHDLTKPAQSINFYVQILQQAPPEVRQEVVQKLEELQSLLRATQQTGTEAIDAEFVTEPEPASRRGSETAISD
ncbi:MAG: hypothetical protein JRD89_00490 [Deltaproteobacteria bacterium]|nr:hypothetical protein [Deltaproteobacteria bacterium]